jgi:mono/diheme cytochrome c family protein
MRILRLLALSLPASLVTALLFIQGCGNSTAEGGDTIKVSGPSRQAVGKYLIQIGGCNDCHTPGAMEGKLPAESEWLTGSPLGFKGPWGTTYAPNLRLKIQPYNEDSFVQMYKKRDAKPPMPWSSLHAMSDEDLGSIWVYIHSLGPAGQPMPDALPPGEEPKGPYITMAPPAIGTGKASPK